MVLYWFGSSFCLAWVAMYWGRDAFSIGLAIAVLAELIWWAVAKGVGLKLVFRAVAALLVIGLLALGWTHIIKYFFTNI